MWSLAARSGSDAVDGLYARAAAWRARAAAAEGGGGGGAARLSVAAPVPTAAPPPTARHSVCWSLAAVIAAATIDAPGRPSAVAGGAPPGRRASPVSARRPSASPPSPTTTRRSVCNPPLPDAELEDALAELRELRAAAAELEAAADGAAAAESRAVAAKAAADAAAAELRCRTPRPPSSAAALGEAGVALGGLAGDVAAAADAARTWRRDDLAAWLAGDGGERQSPPEDTAGCLSSALEAGTLTREAVVAALAAHDGASLSRAARPDTAAAWVTTRVAAGTTTPIAAAALTAWLTGATPGGDATAPLARWFGVAAATPAPALAAALAAAPPSTAARLAAAEAAVVALTAEVERLQREGAPPPPRSRTAAGSVRSSGPGGASADPPPPSTGLPAFLAALEAAGESEPWKDGFPPLGTGPDTPKLLRAAARVRNKGITKRETELTIKNVWKDRVAAGLAAAATPLIDFTFAHLQTRVGVPAAVVKAGYNLVYGLWKYRWDADCELFLCVLTGQVS